MAVSRQQAQLLRLSLTSTVFQLLLWMHSAKAKKRILKTKNGKIYERQTMHEQHMFVAVSISLKSDKASVQQKRVPFFQILLYFFKQGKKF